jgi:hypothetical protein
MPPAHRDKCVVFHDRRCPAGTTFPYAPDSAFLTGRLPLPVPPSNQTLENCSVRLPVDLNDYRIA